MSFLIVKGVIFGAKTLAKIKPGAKVTFKIGTKGAAFGLLAVTPLGEVIVFVALTSLSGLAISIAATFIVFKLADRGIVFVWDEHVVQKWPEVTNTTSETRSNLAAGEFEADDILTLAVPPLRRRVASEIIPEAFETGLGRELNPVENVLVEVIQIGFNILPGFIAVPLLGLLAFETENVQQGEPTRL